MTYVPQTPLVEQYHNAGFIVSLANGHQSIDQVQFAAGLGRLLPGLIIADVPLTYTATPVAGGTNVGNGTVGSITAQPPALAGAYTVHFTDATDFTVTNPYGVAVGAGVVGVAFGGAGLEFTITAGLTAFAANDSFTVTVAFTGGGWGPLTSATSSPVAYAILRDLVDATIRPATAAAVARSAEVNRSELVWDASLNIHQQDTALAALRLVGVLAR
jgi:hypothetical protein